MKGIVLRAIKFYKTAISPSVGFFGFNCRFYPSCSSYTADAVKKYGIIKGSYKAFLRLLKCGPWSKGGVDHVR